MSLPLIAKHLEHHGRGDDTHLVHMTTGELIALQKLAKQHGGSLTINPSTGLPEAGFLSSILPMVAGAALMALAPETGDLSMLANPMVAGGIVGAADYAMTGSLKDGLMAGLGAYGGANLAGSLGQAGLSSITQTGGDISEQAFNAQQKAILDPNNWGETPTTLNTGSIDPVSQAQQIIQQMPNLTADQVTNMTANLTPDNAGSIVKSAGMANAAMGAGPATSLANMGAGLQNITSSGSNALAFAKANPGSVATLGGTLLNAVGGFNQPTIQPVQTSQTNPFNIKPLSPNFQGQFPAQPQPYYQAQYPNYVQNPYSMATAKSGGIMGYSGADGSDVQQGLSMISKRPILQATPDHDSTYIDTDPDTKNLDAYNAAMASLSKINKFAHLTPTKSGLGAVNPLGSDIQTLSQDQLAAEAAQKDIQNNSPVVNTAKEGGLQSHLGDYSDGGRLLKGPGDGVSDGIPAVIGGKQPARLADGEFVIPARIVSELGNGSTDAGAKRLYAMMDRIKDARKKAKDIAADTKAYKHLPA